MKRRLLHERSVHCDGYLRDDGLWEIEARLLDTKAFEYIHPFRGDMRAGDAAHDMTLSLTVDDDLSIVSIKATMDAVPMLACQDVRSQLQKLKGVKLGQGWRKEVARRIGRTENCTHIMGLMTTAVTTLYQTIGMGKKPDGQHALSEASKELARPFFVDGCHGWRADGSAVSELFPQWYVEPDTASEIS